MVGFSMISFGLAVDSGDVFVCGNPSSFTAVRIDGTGIVGCGVTPRREIYFTMNGIFLGIVDNSVFKPISDTMDVLFPSFGSDGSSVIARFNFGQEQFVFDILRCQQEEGILLIDDLDMIINDICHCERVPRKPISIGHSDSMIVLQDITEDHSTLILDDIEGSDGGEGEMVGPRHSSVTFASSVVGGLETESKDDKGKEEIEEGGVVNVGHVQLEDATSTIRVRSSDGDGKEIGGGILRDGEKEEEAEDGEAEGGEESSELPETHMVRVRKRYTYVDSDGDEVSYEMEEEIPESLVDETCRVVGDRSDGPNQDGRRRLSVMLDHGSENADQEYRTYRNPEAVGVSVSNAPWSARDSDDSFEYHDTHSVPKRPVVKIGSWEFTLPFTRVDFDSLFDRERNVTGFIAGIILVFATSFLVMYKCEEFHESEVIILFFVVAGAQYSLIRSPSPDSHAYSLDNSATRFSRSFHFCWTLLLSIVCDTLGDSYDIFLTVKVFLLKSILFYPILFAAGWLPQWSTWIHVVAEQTHMMLFGGSGTADPLSSVFGTFMDTSVLFVSTRFLPADDENHDRGVLHLGLVSFMVTFLTCLPSRLGFWKDVFLELRPSQPRKMSRSSPHAQWLGKSFIGAVGLSGLCCAGFLLFNQFDSGDMEVLWKMVLVMSFVISFTKSYLLPQFMRLFPFNLRRGPLLKGHAGELVSTMLGYTSNVSLVLFFVCQYSLWFKKGRTSYSSDTMTMILMSAGLVKQLRLSIGDSSNMHWVLLVISFTSFTDDPFFGSNDLDRTIQFLTISTIVMKSMEATVKIEFILSNSFKLKSDTHFVEILLMLGSCGLLLFEVIVGTFLNCPLQPCLGTSFLLMSYPRSARFWERTSHGEGLLDTDEETAFRSTTYARLTRSLQDHLPWLIRAGYFGNVHTGDTYLLTDGDSSTVFIHIIEIGTGHLSFQVRGLEFSGTFCHDQEIGAVHRMVEDYDDINMKKLFWSKRWRSWHPLSKNVTVNMFNINTNRLSTLASSFDEAKVLLREIIRALIEEIYDVHTEKPIDFSTFQYDDVRGVFLREIDHCKELMSDYGSIGKTEGVTFESFLKMYEESLQRFTRERGFAMCCFLSSVRLREALFENVSYECPQVKVLHERMLQLYSGMHQVVGLGSGIAGRAIIVGLRCFMETFISGPEEFNSDTFSRDTRKEIRDTVRFAVPDNQSLQEAIGKETADEIFTLRRHHGGIVAISLKLNAMQYYSIRVNREGVRGIWAGQQWELVYFENQDSERSSIQQRTRMLRNIVSQSADPPIGYPAFISEVVTSFS
eukprot:TRINITY_DN424_c0_g1_i2.p1 TRINITY_DN424_c0_g1~~TRINITY_DN424_c0_g1_i2.p1  ORF type:complete len:1297 (-),score=322.66 TRINITY_DN424_c0_g1_i2:1899-5789(-)